MRKEKGNMENALYDKLNLNKLLFWLIFAAGLFARVYQFGLVPCGLNQDEAYAGYEAWLLLSYGADTAGYHFPVYLPAWGSGMNALETYLMMPFIAIFGLKVWVIRLPQLIVSLLSLWVVYLLLRRTVNERVGLITMFMLAICPWHIIMSRWGLESNLAPGFLLFGLYFFVRGLDDQRYFILSALMYGLSLYAYAVIWIFVPVVILLLCVYCLCCGKLRFDKNIVISIAVLFVLALPLMLFLAINYGFMNEICLPFVSIPELDSMRAGEISINGLDTVLDSYKHIFIEQNDGFIWNSPEKYGLFYYISIPFAVLGLAFCIKQAVIAAKSKAFCAEVLLLVQLVVGLVMFFVLDVNVNRVNLVFIPFVIMASLGVYFVSTVKIKYVLPVVAAVYCLLFAGFESYYFTDYADDTRASFSYGLDKALDVADEHGDTVYLDPYEFYIKVLFYEQTPLDVFCETAQNVFYPSSEEYTLSFDKFYFWIDTEKPEENAAYVMPRRAADLGKLPEAGFSFETIGEYIVAYKD